LLKFVDEADVDGGIKLPYDPGGILTYSKKRYLSFHLVRR
jgi:hypothetical protein